MRASTKRAFSILIAVGLFIASLIVYASFIQPAYSEIKNLRTEVVSRSKLIQEQEVSLRQVQKILSDYQNVAQLKETISLILPLEQNLPQAANQIIGLANVNKLTVDQLSVQQLAIKPSGYSSLVKGRGTLRLNFRLVGNYEGFKSFIQGLETNMNLMDLVSLKIDPVIKTGASTNNFTYTLSVDTYYQAP